MTNPTKVLPKSTVIECDPPDPCSECGSLELWETFAGNWRCLRCDPPTESRRLVEKAAQLRERTAWLKSDRPGRPRTPQGERKGRPLTQNTYGATVP